MIVARMWLGLISQSTTSIFKTLDTSGNCQRPFFSLGVSQNKHIKPVTVWAQLFIEIAREQCKKNTLVALLCALLGT